MNVGDLKKELSRFEDDTAVLIVYLTFSGEEEVSPLYRVDHTPKSVRLFN